MGRVAAEPRTTRARVHRTPNAGLAAVALGLMVWSGPTEARSAPAKARSAPLEATSEPAPGAEAPESTRTRDPNELPPLPPPGGQPAPDSLRRDVDHTTDASDRQRLQLTLAPVYASIRLPFLGRPDVPRRGGGFAMAARVPVWRPLGLRLSLAHTMHAAYDEFTRDDDDLVQTAAGGMIQATHAGLSATYTMDLGRVMTTLDAGVGGLWIRSPDAVQDGQFGGTCRPEGVCDTGLVCSAANVCEVGLTPQVQGGFALDVLVGDRFTVGGELRYFALLATPTVYPVYLVAALRAGLRF